MKIKKVVFLLPITAPFLIFSTNNRTTSNNLNLTITPIAECTKDQLARKIKTGKGFKIVKSYFDENCFADKKEDKNIEGESASKENLPALSIFPNIKKSFEFNGCYYHCPCSPEKKINESFAHTDNGEISTYVCSTSEDIEKKPKEGTGHIARPHIVHLAIGRIPQVAKFNTPVGKLLAELLTSEQDVTIFLTDAEMHAILGKDYSAVTRAELQQFFASLAQMPLAERRKIFNIQANVDKNNPPAGKINVHQITKVTAPDAKSGDHIKMPMPIDVR